MFYKNDSLAFELLNVFELKRPKGIIENKGRVRSALSLRITGQTQFFYNNKTVVAEAGSVVYIPTGLDYKRISEEEEELIIFHLKTYGPEQKDIQVLTFQGYMSVMHYFYEILDEWEQRKPGYKNRCMSILYSLFAQLEELDEPYNLKGEQQILKNGILYLHMHFDNPALTVSDLAERCGISEVYFRKLYKAVFGISPRRAINKMKIKRACQLLETGYFRVSEAAEKSGFINVKHFSTVFKKETGMSPMEYMKT